MAVYRVTAPYVTLKVRDVTGKASVMGFYKDARVDRDQVDSASLKRHLDRGYVELVEQGEPARESTPEPQGEPPAEPTGEARPGQNAPKSEWVDFAVAQGVDRDEADSLTKADLINLLK